MSGIIEQLRGLSTAEDFFTVLDVPYDQGTVNVSRLHILKRFQQYMRQDAIAEMPEANRKAACAAALKRAHDDFVTSTGVEEKVFKVFQDQQPTAPAFVSLDTLKAGRT